MTTFNDIAMTSPVLATELRSLRDPYNAYDSGRGGTSRGWPSSDPYDRGYGYERRY